VLAPDADTFVERLRNAGISGLIVPDLPMGEEPAITEACAARGVALVPLVAPTTTDERLALIGAQARGFVYTVSVTGTTGERDSREQAFAELVGRVKRRTEAPVALGFGIATPQHAAEAARAGADGVIVGTRLVRAAAESDDPAAATGELVAKLAAGLIR
jgi:tryptophan synthase alpha chain